MSHSLHCIRLHREREQRKWEDDLALEFNFIKFTFYDWCVTEEFTLMAVSGKKKKDMPGNTRSTTCLFLFYLSKQKTYFRHKWSVIFLRLPLLRVFRFQLIVHRIASFQQFCSFISPMFGDDLRTPESGIRNPERRKTCKARWRWHPPWIAHDKSLLLFKLHA